MTGDQVRGRVSVDCVVSHNLHLAAERTEQMGQVVRERVVVVDQQNHLRPSASSIASSNAASFRKHSSCSAGGLESATIPAPACSRATPSCKTIVRIAMQVSSVPPGSE